MTHSSSAASAATIPDAAASPRHIHLDPDHKPPGTRLSREQKRRRALTLLTLFVLLAAGAAIAWYLLVGEWNESTDDAYVAGDMAQINSQIPGTLVSVKVRDGDKVQAGDVLAELDPTDTAVALAQAKSALANAVRQSHGLFNQANSAQSDLAARAQALSTARSDYERRVTLARTGAVSSEEVDHARQSLEAAQAAYNAARQQYDARRVLVAGTELSTQPAVEVAAAQLRAAYLNSRRNAILSPLDGYVARRTAQVGQRVQPGQAMMTIVPLQDVWIDANFKETQLRKMRIGQPATIETDLYGSKVRYTGKVASLGVGTGSVFALLPAQNATGNWIKIVQRIPVRITLDQPQQLEQHPLRLGMSTTVEVDIHNQSGPLLAQQPAPGAVQTTDVYARYSAQADALIAQVIQENRPGTAGKKG